MMTIKPCQGPRPTTKRPSLKAPPGACDCHTHIIGPESRYPFTPDRSFTPPDASCGGLLAVLGTLGFDRAIIVQGSFHGGDNSRVVDAVADLGQHRARGVAMVRRDIDDRTLRDLTDAGIRGARFITVVRGGAAIEDLREVARRVAPFGWHVEMFVPNNTLPDLLPIVADLPAPVVFGHVGAFPADTDINDQTLRQFLRLLESGRCWVKLTGYRFSRSGHPYADLNPLIRLFVDNALERCIWGSDWPHTQLSGYMPDDGDLLDLFGDWVPGAVEQRKILSDNPAELYGFEALP